MIDQHVDTISGLLKSISHPLRLKILCELMQGEKTAGEIQSVVATTKANVSQHLNIMRHQGVIKSRKDANFVFNRIGDPRVTQLMATLQALYCREN